jgi:hypothetical protein
MAKATSFTILREQTPRNIWWPWSTKAKVMDWCLATVLYDALWRSMHLHAFLVLSLYVQKRRSRDYWQQRRLFAKADFRSSCSDFGARSVHAQAHTGSNTNTAWQEITSDKGIRHTRVVIPWLTPLQQATCFVMLHCRSPFPETVRMLVQTCFGL